MFGQGILSGQKGKRAPFLGLDIGSYSIKALKFGLTKEGPVIEDLAEMEIPLDVRQLGRDPEALAKAVRTCLEDGGIDTKGVVIIMITGANAFIRRITMPPMPLEELEAAIPFVAAKFVPFPIEQAALDYTLVGEKEEDGVMKQDILLVATPRDILEREIGVTQAMGLKPIAATVAPIALWNSFQLSESGTEGRVIAQLDIGYERSSICFFNEGLLEFARTVNVGGNDITKSLMSAALLGGEEGKRTLTYEEAEAIKFEHGFPPAGKEGTTKEGVALSQVSMLTRPVLEKLLNEIRMSFDFYSTKFHAPKSEKVVLSGGGALLKGLKDFLAGELGMEVELAAPFRKVRFADGLSKEGVKAVSPAFAMVFGLAAWEVGDMSLLPRIRAKRDRNLVVTFVALGMATTLVMFYFYWGIHDEKRVYEVELQNKMSQLAEFTRMSVSTRAHKLIKRRNELMAKINAFPRELRGSIDSARVLKELRLSMPGNVSLREVEISPIKEVSKMGGGKKGVNVRGTAFAIDERGPTVADFMYALESSPVFDKVRLLYMEEDEGFTVGGSKFHLGLRCSTPVGG
ncbi:MAG: type IV pilus assembly protein PilM [Candidatus Brocadiales bacterium]